jgi:hypothetical protein
MTAKWIGCAAENFSPGRSPGQKPEAIVVHVMEGTLAGADAWFKNPESKVSAHYGIGRRGELHQYVKEDDTAFHAGVVKHPSWTSLKPGVNPNSYTIGIEHEGDGRTDWTDAQYAAGGALIREIASRWGIPVDRQHIVGHHEIRADKTCPGPISFSRLLAAATENLQPKGNLMPCTLMEDALGRIHGPSGATVTVEFTSADGLIVIAAADYAGAALTPVGGALTFTIVPGQQSLIVVFAMPIIMTVFLKEQCEHATKLRIFVFDPASPPHHFLIVGD